MLEYQFPQRLFPPLEHLQWGISSPDLLDEKHPIHTSLVKSLVLNYVPFHFNSPTESVDPLPQQNISPNSLCICSLQRPLPHLVTSSSRSDDFLASFRPYHGRDAIRTLSSLPSIGLNSPTAATAAAFYHPAILSHPPYQHPPYRWISYDQHNECTASVTPGQNWGDQVNPIIQPL